MKNIINLRSPIVENILPGKDKCLHQLTKQYQFQKTLIDTTTKSTMNFKHKRSQSTQNLININSSQKRMDSGKLIVGSVTKNNSNIIKSLTNSKNEPKMN